MFDRIALPLVAAVATLLALVSVALGLKLYFVHGELVSERAERSAVEQQRQQVVDRAVALVVEVNELRLKARERNIREAHDDTSRAHRDAVAGAGFRLRDVASDFAARGCPTAGDPGPAAGGPTAPAAAVVLADLLGRVDGAAEELALAYDLARAAGLTCEREHDALNATAAAASAFAP